MLRLGEVLGLRGGELREPGSATPHRSGPLAGARSRYCAPAVAARSLRPPPVARFSRLPDFVKGGQRGQYACARCSEDARGVPSGRPRLAPAVPARHNRRARSPQPAIRPGGLGRLCGRLASPGDGNAFRRVVASTAGSPLPYSSASRRWSASSCRPTALYPSTSLARVFEVRWSSTPSTRRTSGSSCSNRVIAS